jgi:hypothetical protein
MKKRPYFTLAEWRGYPLGFTPQFGDYERATVEDERDEMLRHAGDNNPSGYTASELKKHFRIVRTSTDTQLAIDVALVALNERTFKAGLRCSAPRTQQAPGACYVSGRTLAELNENLKNE